jgi:hypothetical protein
MLLTGVRQGPSALGKCVKQWATEAQAHAVGAAERQKKVGFAPRLRSFIKGTLVSEWTRKNAWTFANVGRSIPPPPMDMKLEEIELNDWAKRLTAPPHDVPESLLDELRTFVETKVQRLLQKDTSDATWESLTSEEYLQLGPVGLNNSASLEKSRAKGGVYTYYLERAAKMKGGSFSIPAVTPPEHPRACETVTESLPSGQFLGSPPAGAAAWLAANTSTGLDRPATEPTIPPAAPRHVRRILLEQVVTYLIEKDMDELLAKGPLSTRPLGLPERGQKIRIASISPAAAVAAGQRINKFLLKLLKRTPVHSYMLTGAVGIPRGVRQGCHRWIHEKDFEITSTDLSAASDWIPHRVADAVWQGVCGGAGTVIPPSFVQYGKACLGPQRLENLPDCIHEYEGSTTSTGILMGLPLTWPILSWINEFCGAKATQTFNAREAAEGRKMTSTAWRSAGTHRPFAVGGDDFIGAWTTRHRQLYEKNITDLGLKVNRHKTFTSPVGGIFLEKLFLLGSKEVPQEYRAHEADQAPVLSTLFEWIAHAFHPNQEQRKLVRKLSLVERPLLSALCSAKAHGRRGVAEGVPAYLSLPSVLQEAVKLSSEPWRKKAVIRVGEQVHATTFSRWRKSGIPMCWPQSLGGWGVPGVPSAPSHFRKAAASILSEHANARAQQKKLLSTFVVSAAPKNLRKILDRQVEMTCNLPEQLPAAEVDEQRHGSYEPVFLHDAVGTVVARTLSFYSLDPESSKLDTRKAATVGEIARRIRRIIDSYATRWKSVKPIDPHKAVQLDASLSDRRVDLRGIDSVLYYTGTPDVMIQLVRKELRASEATGFTHSRPSEDEEEGITTSTPDAPIAIATEQDSSLGRDETKSDSEEYSPPAEAQQTLGSHESPPNQVVTPSQDRLDESATESSAPLPNASPAPVGVEGEVPPGGNQGYTPTRFSPMESSDQRQQTQEHAEGTLSSTSRRDGTTTLLSHTSSSHPLGGCNDTKHTQKVRGDASTARKRTQRKQELVQTIKSAKREMQSRREQPRTRRLADQIQQRINRKRVARGLPPEDTPLRRQGAHGAALLVLENELRQLETSTPGQVGAPEEEVVNSPPPGDLATAQMQDATSTPDNVLAYSNDEDEDEDMITVR